MASRAERFRADIQPFGVLSEDLERWDGVPGINTSAGVRLRRPSSEPIPAHYPGRRSVGREQVLPSLVASATVLSQDEARSSSTNYRVTGRRNPLAHPALVARSYRPFRRATGA